MKERLTIKQLPEMDRPYEKMEKMGCQVLSDAELLAIIIKTGYRNETSVDLARKLLHDEGLEYIKKVTLEQLKKQKGIGRVKALQLIALRELSVRMAALQFKENGNFISSPEDVSGYLMERMRYLKKEIFKLLILDNKNKILKEESISVGSLDQTIVHPREVFYEAIRHMAKSVILVHNHPSGDPKPSQNDIETTDRLVECGNLIGIKVLDHIIIGNGMTYSFKNHGLI
ncbi:MAG: DNA repair protein RadC [Clostridia bacterium]|nr:DNA repair protein RadC [Clostridia bacterium]